MDLCLTNIPFFTAQDVKLMDWSHVDYCDCFYQLFELFEKRPTNKKKYRQIFLLSSSRLIS